MSSTHANPLSHHGACTGPRDLHVTAHEHGITTLHCVDCGAHRATAADGQVMPEPRNPGPFHGTKPGLYDGITIERMGDQR